MSQKYHAQPTVVDGIRFDSKGEAMRWLELRGMEQRGEIHSLSRQVAYPLSVNDAVICTYKFDFVYVDAETGRWVFEDFKGYRTREYLIKKKLVKAVLGIDILETR